VVDAAGAIYVIGGHGSGYPTDLNDVYASTDGGARPDSRRGVDRWGTRGGTRVGTQGFLSRTKG
jgi:hypothetical protein